MRLPSHKKLMGILALQLMRGEVDEIFAAAASSFSPNEKEKCQAPIHLLSALWKKQGTKEAFVTELERLFKICEYTHLLQIIREFKMGQSNDAPGQPNDTHNLASIEGGIEHFKSMQIELSRIITKAHREIMIELADIPESAKERIDSSLQLFVEMECYGKISENDVKLLQEMFDLLQLAKEKAILHKYTTGNATLASAPNRHQRGIASTSQQPKERKRNRDPEEDAAQSPPAKAAAIGEKIELRPLVIHVVHVIYYFSAPPATNLDHQGCVNLQART